MRKILHGSETLVFKPNYSDFAGKYERAGKLMSINRQSQPLFILGTQRSGTTLLARILSSHKDIFIQNEISVEKVFEGVNDPAKMLSLMDVQIQERHGDSLEDVLQKEGKSVWGVKDPELTYHLEKLEQFIPESKMLLILRDGRGVVNSYMENKWGLGTNAYTGAIRWKEEVEQLLDFAERHKEQVLVVRFEDLITGMEAELRRICSHFGVEFDPEMLKYDKKKAMFKENPHNVNTNKAPDITLAEKWQSRLSPREVGIIEYVAGDTLKAHGYELAGEKVCPSAIERAYYLVHQKIIGEIQLQWQWRRSLIRKKKKAGTSVS